MFGLFKKKKQESEVPQPKKEEYNFKWHEPGEGNPFNKRILDIRGLTQTMVAVTSDKDVAETYGKRRGSIGDELVDIQLPDLKTISANLEYPHNGSKIEGAAYRAKAMEDKWDIYVWKNIMYLTRSWTGVVNYKAYINITQTNFTITKIEYSETELTKEDPSLVIDNVHFIVLAHAFGRIFPHRVPKTLTTEKEIALYSFGQFGRNCGYATYDTIVNTVISPKRKE